MASMGSGMAIASTFGRTTIHRSGGVYESANGTPMRSIGAGLHVAQATALGNPTPAQRLAAATPPSAPLTVTLPQTLTVAGRVTGRVNIANLNQDVAQTLTLKVSANEVEIPSYNVKIPVKVQASNNETLLQGVHLNNATRTTFTLDLRLNASGQVKTMTLRHDGGGGYDPNWRPQFTFTVK